MTIWMTARGAGLAALVLLTVSTTLGALGARRGPAGRRVVLQYVHRTAGALGIGVLALHIVTIVADSYAHVGVTGAVIPFTSGYRATWVGLGTIAMYALLLVAGFGFARGRLAATSTGARVWRMTHLLAYGAWAVAMLHGYTSGTDSDVAWVIALYVLCLISVGGALAVRLAGLSTRVDPRRELPRVTVIPLLTLNRSAALR
jgi:methionine sulfoxide reductase heme-binding subunit